MKEKRNIKTLHTAFQIFVLAFLLLLSPCKVRNYIQIELGAPKTEISNKNQFTFNNASCSNVEIASNALAKEKSSTPKLSAISTDFKVLFDSPHFSNNNIQPQGTTNHSSVVVPFYILYQNSKHYL